MRIAIAATAPDEGERINRHAARAEFYMVFDETGMLCEVILNPFKDYDQAVGMRVADYLAEKSVDVLAAGNLGVGFMRALDAKGIRYVESKGIIRDIAKDLAARFAAA
jgi:predicted Fe-Mo cluster-binding NifX family protein